MKIFVFIFGLIFVMQFITNVYKYKAKIYTYAVNRIRFNAKIICS